jgi:hypothetical protein
MLRTAFGPSLCKPVFICRSVVRFASILLLCLIVRENAPAEEEVIRLWPGAAPGSESWTQKEVRFNDASHGGEAIRNVVDPTLNGILANTRNSEGNGRNCLPRWRILTSQGCGQHRDPLVPVHRVSIPA